MPLSDETKFDLQLAAQTALAVQDACNIRPVIEEMAKAIVVIQKANRELPGDGTDWWNQHAIMRLYVSKLMHLSRFENEVGEYGKAHDICEAMAKGDFTHINVQA